MDDSRYFFAVTIAQFAKRQFQGIGGGQVANQNRISCVSVQANNLVATFQFFGQR